MNALSIVFVAFGINDRR